MSNFERNAQDSAPETRIESGIARRVLLKGTGLAAAGLATTGILPEPAEAEQAARPHSAGRTEPNWLPGVPNGRDIGGLGVEGGKLIRTGLALRTAALAGATPDGLAGLRKAGVASVIDLRTEAEVKAQPDPKIAGAEEIYLNVFGASMAAGVADFTNPQGTRASADAMMIQSYREMVTLDTAHASYRRFLQIAMEGKPFAFHCTEGKDRTGWGAALLLRLLGASSDQIRADYLLSNVGLVAQNAGIERQMKAANPNVNMAVLTAYLTVSLDFLNAAYAEVDARFGSFKGYVEKALGFDDKAHQELRRIYLV